MFRFALFASCVALVSACRYSLEDGGQSITADSSVDAPLSASCMEAITRSDLNFIETKIFATSCIFSGCHNGANTDAGRLDLREGMAHAALVNKDSAIAPTYKYVVPTKPNESHLLLMIQHITPEMMSPPTTAPDPQIGYMPQNAGGRAICVQKREAIERWIMAGAPAT
ncbi:MAG: hypothetical protein H0T42_29475 [Deltaproteobacteria bacterium]|nr:hypothetical protein [Deltaproteobacteria bacterium]